MISGRHKYGPSPTNPSWSTKYGGGNGSPAFHGTTPQGMSGYPFSTQYQTINDPSHQPAPWIVPLIRTGHALFNDIAVADTCSVIASCPDNGENVTSSQGYTYDLAQTYFWTSYNNARSAGWAIRTLGTCHRLMSDADPMRPYIAHIFSENTLFAGVGPYNPTNPDYSTNLGMIYIDNETSSAGSFAASNFNGGNPDVTQGQHLFMNGIITTCWGVEIRLDTTGNWKTLWNKIKPTAVLLYDDEQQYNGQNINAGYMLEWYACCGWDASQTVFTNVATQLADQTQQTYHVAAPYPATGIWNAGIGNPGSSGATAVGEQSIPIVGGIHMASYFDSDALRVSNQIETRINTPATNYAGAGQVYSGNDGWYPTWAIEISGQG